MFEMLMSALSECCFFLSYVTGKNEFPQKLSPEREKDCIRRLQKGDKQAKQELIEHNLRLVAHISRKFQNSSLENDDLISIGTIGLIKAVNTFSASSGTSLATYAARCIENPIPLPRTQPYI